MATPTFNSQQIIYTFGSSAGSAGDLRFPDVPTMQAYVTKVESQILADPIIQGLIGTDWSPVWGPTTHTEDTSGTTVVSDNQMGCYYSPTQNMFVIGVAGTNPLSLFDWLVEDFEVRTLVPWTQVSPGAGSAGSGSTGNLSSGAAIGINILLNVMTDSTGDTLLVALGKFISKNNMTGATVAVTGHSLGGALSPCLALYLVENRGQWGSATFPVSVYATAGPTPGDNDFATYYGTVVTAKNITYSSAYNSLDVVPLAWAPANLATIPTLYDSNIKPAKTDSPPDAFMGVITCGLAINALAAPPPYTVGSTVILQGTINPYAQVAGRSLLTGAFATLTDLGVKIVIGNVVGYIPASLNTAYGASFTNVARFIVQAGYQHTTAYSGTSASSAGLLIIGAFSAEYQTIRTANKPATAVESAALAEGMRRLTGVRLPRIDALMLESLAAGAVSG